MAVSNGKRKRATPSRVYLPFCHKKSRNSTRHKGFLYKSRPFACIKLNRCPKLARFWRLIIEEMLSYNPPDVEKRKMHDPYFCSGIPSDKQVYCLTSDVLNCIIL
jgi:hypothetical protein